MRSTQDDRPSKTRHCAVAVAAVALLGTACGGDDDSADSASGADFCAEFAAVNEQLEVSPDGVLDEDAWGMIAGLAGSAPNDELREALELFGEVDVLMQDVDLDDPDSFGPVFEIVMDPRFDAASDTIEEYATGTCGIEFLDHDS